MKPIKTDPDFWLREHKYTFLFNSLNLMALHGFLCLALRHPGTKDHACRPAIVGIVKEIGMILVDLGALTPDALMEVQRVEVEEGSKDFEEIINPGMQ
jgi:hypothetical protein